MNRTPYTEGFFRGRAYENKRATDIIETMMDDYQPASEEFDVLADAVALIRPAEIDQLPEAPKCGCGKNPDANV